MALVNVTVTDPYNRLVTGLDPDNFRVFEDNFEQEIVTFSAEDVPISIIVIFDFSGIADKISKISSLPPLLALSTKHTGLESLSLPPTQCDPNCL